MKKIIICIMICFVVVNNVAIMADAENNAFSLMLTRGSSAYIQVPRSSNDTSYVTVRIKSIDGISPVYISLVDSSFKSISNTVIISGTSGVGAYTLDFNTPIASGTDVYVRFYSGYYSINISGYVT